MERSQQHFFIGPIAYRHARQLNDISLNSSECAYEGGRNTDGRVVCRSKDRANTPGDYIKQFSLEGLSPVLYMTGVVAYLGSKGAELLTP